MKRQFSRGSLLRGAVPIAILILLIATVALAESRCPMTTKVISSPNPSVPYESVTVTATVTCDYHPVPDGGTVNFYTKYGSIGSGTTVNGEVSVTTVFDEKGSYVIRADYSGVQIWRPSKGHTRQYVREE